MPDWQAKILNHMLEIKNLSSGYQNKIVLENLNFSVAFNHLHGLVGLNGSGKTTLLNSIHGNLTPKTGTISFFGQKISKNDIAFLETENFFYSKLTGLEYLKLFSYKNPHFEIQKWNQLFDLPLKKLIETYSSGMKKKLALMGILSLNRPLIMLDEPFNGVDMESNRTIQIILEELKTKGHSIIITSHILESLTSICDQISFLNNRAIEFTVDKTNFDTIQQRIFSQLDDNTLKIIKEITKTD